MELKYKKWNQVPIKVYEQLNNIFKDKKTSLLNKEAEMLSILCNTDIDIIYSLNIQTIQNLVKQCNFIKKSPEIKSISLKSIKINDVTYDIVKSFDEFSYAQFVDFQVISKQEDENIAGLLSTIIIPHGKTYNNGYHITDVIDDINNYLDIETANSLIFFYTDRLNRQYNIMTIYLQVQQKMIMWMTKLKMKMKKLYRKTI